MTCLGKEIERKIERDIEWDAKRARIRRVMEHRKVLEKQTRKTVGNEERKRKREKNIVMECQNTYFAREPRFLLEIKINIFFEYNYTAA